MWKRWLAGDDIPSEKEEDISDRTLKQGNKRHSNENDESFESANEEEGRLAREEHEQSLIVGNSIENDLDLERFDQVLQLKDEEIFSLEDSVNEIKEEYDELSLENKDLNKKLQEEINEKEKIIKEKQKYRDELQKYRQKYIELTRKYIILSEKNVKENINRGNTLYKTIEKLNEEIDKLNEEKNNNIILINNIKEEYNNKIVLLEKKNDLLKMDIDHRDKNIIHLNNENNEMKEKIELLKDEINDKIDKIQDLEIDNKYNLEQFEIEKKDILNIKNTKIIELENLLHSNMNENNELKKSLDQHREWVSNLKYDMKQLQIKKKDTEKRLIEENNNEVETLIKLNLSFESSLHEKNEDIFTLNEYVNSLKNTIENEIKEKNKYISKCEELEKIVKERNINNNNNNNTSSNTTTTTTTTKNNNNSNNSDKIEKSSNEPVNEIEDVSESALWNMIKDEINVLKDEINNFP